MCYNLFSVCFPSFIPFPSVYHAIYLAYIAFLVCFLLLSFSPSSRLSFIACFFLFFFLFHTSAVPQSPSKKLNIIFFHIFFLTFVCFHYFLSLVLPLLYILPFLFSFSCFYVSVILPLHFSSLPDSLLHLFLR